MFKLTPAILVQLSPKLSTLQAEEWVRAITDVCPLYGIDTADIAHEFLANVLHESGGLTQLEENLNYSTAALLKMFGRHRITQGEALKYGRQKGQTANQKMIAIMLYGGNFGKQQLGNTQPTDGWDFRGSGPIQMTGRSNFTLFAGHMRSAHNELYNLQQLAQMVRTDKRIAMHSACWIFAISKKLIDAAITDNMNLIVKRINGGYIGMEDRMAYYTQCKKLIVDA
jgi:putative chitinase